MSMNMYCRVTKRLQSRSESFKTSTNHKEKRSYFSKQDQSRPTVMTSGLVSHESVSSADSELAKRDGF